jgi:hypothetical protein
VHNILIQDPNKQAVCATNSLPCLITVITVLRLEVTVPDNLLLLALLSQREVATCSARHCCRCHLQSMSHSQNSTFHAALLRVLLFLQVAAYSHPAPPSLMTRWQQAAQQHSTAQWWQHWRRASGQLAQWVPLICAPGRRHSSGSKYWPVL